MDLFTKLPILAQTGDAIREGRETTFHHTWTWPPWITAAFLILAALLVAWAYFRESQLRQSWLRWLLIAMRVSLIMLVVVMLYGWMRQEHRTDLPDLVILVDTSASMEEADFYEDDRLRAAMAKRLQAAGLGKATRINLARLLLIENNQELARELSKRYNLKFYQVGRAARTLNADVERWEETVRGLSAEDNESRLGQCIREVLAMQRGRPPACMIVLSDGITTQGKSIGEIAEIAQRQSVPLFIVGLGSSQSSRDVMLSQPLADELAFVGDLIHFDFKVTSRGYEKQKAEVRLRRDGDDAVLSRQQVTLDKDGVASPLRLSHRPGKKGNYTYRIEVDTLDGESNITNNQRTKTVSVRNETIRVLLVQERPNLEFRNIKRVLSRGLRRAAGAGPDAETKTRKAFDLSVVLQEADLDFSKVNSTALRVFPVKREELFKYDVLIIGDADPRHFSQNVMKNIADFVTERGGGIVFIAGPRHTPFSFRGTPLESLFPIQLDTATLPQPAELLGDGFPVQITPLGKRSPQMQLADTDRNSERIWDELPSIRWLLNASDVRRGTRVLLEHPTRAGTNGDKLPIICMHFAGAGKIVFHCTDETWLWTGYESGDDYFSRYWIQTIRYLSRAKLLGQSRAAELTSDRDVYQRGDPVRLVLRFTDDRQAPAADDGVTIVMEHEGRRQRQIKLRRLRTSRGVFEGSISNLASGNYRAWLANPTLKGAPPTRRFQVVAPKLEKTRLEMEETDLKTAAEKTSGEFFTFSQADELRRELPRGRQIRIESQPPAPIWNSPWLAALFVILIVSEWLIRKRIGML